MLGDAVTRRKTSEEANKMLIKDFASVNLRGL